ncbi:unnamed protein product [Ectocarpus sp. CCAP 1310/34]|nr:unnamed protein product [Ectocarpus sp. CCAP 1310/34]
MSHAQMLSLYRQIIRNARVYPSKSRDRVLKEIRVEFRKNATESDPVKVDKQRQLAMKGLQQLMVYTKMDTSGLDMSVTLEQNPLGGPTQQ